MTQKFELRNRSAILFIFLGICLILLTNQSTALDLNITTSNITQTTILRTDFPTSIPFSDVVAYFTFDAADSSTVYDFSDNLNDGIYQNGASSATGLFGNSLDLDGVNDHVNITSISDYNFTSSNMTFSVWFNQDAIAASKPILTTGAYDFALRTGFLNEDALQFYFTDVDTSGNCAVLADGILTDTDWHHVAVTYNQSKLVMYFDGSFVAETDCDPAITPRYTSTLPIDIGGGPSPSVYFAGQIDEVIMIKQALDSSQITDLYNNQSARFQTQSQEFIQNLDVKFPLNITLSLSDYGTLFNSLINVYIGEWDYTLGYNETDLDGSNSLVSYYHFDEARIIEGGAEFPIQTNHTFIPTYDGSNQTIHPSLLYFENGWNGWKYWMGNTPYPFSDDNYENPIIHTCNYSCLEPTTTWEVPEGLVNPINSTAPVNFPTGYHADIDIVYDEDNDMLRAYYMDYDGTAIVHLLMQNSSDGITWNYEQEVFSWDKSGGDDNCRSWGILEGSDNVWHMWCEINDAVHRVQYYNSTDGISDWTLVGNVTFSQNPGYLWHLDVIEVPSLEEYWMVYSLLEGSGGNIYFANASTSNASDFTAYDYPALKHSSLGWENKSLYRPTLLFNISGDEQIHIWYGGYTDQTETYTGYSNQTYSSLLDFLYGVSGELTCVDAMGWRNGTNVRNANTNQSEGQYYGSVGFDGTSGHYIDLGTTLSNNSEGTVTAWFKTNDINFGEQTILSLKEGDSGLGDFWNFGVYDGDGGYAFDANLKIRQFNSAGSTVFTGYADTTEIQSNQWYFVAVSMSATDGLKMYVNGEEEVIQGYNSAKSWWDDIDYLANWYVGTSHYNDLFAGSLNGSVDELMIFNRTLSSIEIRELYSAGRANYSYSSQQSYSGSDLNFTVSERESEKLAVLLNFTSGDDQFYTPWFVGNLSYTLVQDDSTPPIITITSPTSTTYNTSTIYFNASADEDVSSWIVNYNGTNATLPEINTSLTVEDGRHNLIFYALDVVNNVGSNSSVSFIVDTTGPEPTLISPVNGYSQSSSSTTVTFQFNISEAIHDPDTCKLFLDGTESNSTTSPSEYYANEFIITSISLGSHSWYITCNDTLNNWANSATYSFSIVSPTEESQSSQTSSRKSYTPSDSDISEGYSKFLYTTSNLNINIGGSRHSLKVSSLNPSAKKATITVSSKPQTKTLNVGEIWQVDLDLDGTLDLLVRLESVTASRAEVFIQEIQKSATSSQPEEEEPQTTVESEDESQESTEPSWTTLLFLLGLACLFFVAVLVKVYWKQIKRLG